ncbi:reelin [Nephila pilipes]|uniref:Reelin n=1 Tax=Nephila pilipes TaxID=299642 RepID=A0A8X6MNF7_NEPPI|nr:reelin [Nephila pilipes]
MKAGSKEIRVVFLSIGHYRAVPTGHWMIELLPIIPFEFPVASIYDLLAFIMRSILLKNMAAMLQNPSFVFAFFLLAINLNIQLINTQNLASVASPFFFLCQYHRDLDQPGAVRGEIALSVNIKGNPEYYEPGKVYEVTVSSSLDFDGFLMTGLYTAPSGTMAKTMNLLNPNLPNEQDGVRGLVCAIVHSHLSHRPAKSLMFLWMAPPSGTGCVNFLATASLGHEVLFKDTLALQLCEAGDSATSTDNPVMSVVHDPGLVIREDFENYDAANSLIWSEMISGVVNDQCGSVLHGKAATFCSATGPRSLTTVSLNTTTASTLQFALGVGNCSIAVDEPPINVYYGTGKCTKWHELEQIRLQPAVETTVHILCLPPSAKATDVCFQWHQESSSSSGKFKGCWAIDNIIISSVSDRPKFVEDNFDPIDPGNFLFFPGGTVQRKCHSDGNALTFSGHGRQKRAVVTRDLDMSTVIASEDILFNEMFNKAITSWVVKGGELSSKCEISNYKQALVMSAKGTRIFCSPFVDAAKAGNLRFHFLFGKKVFFFKFKIIH